MADAAETSAKLPVAEPGPFGRALNVAFSVLSTPLGFIGTTLVAVIILTAIFAPQLAPYPATAINVKERLADPSLSHWLGTDQLGRDLVSRVIIGTRTAMSVALTALAIALAESSNLGLIGFARDRHCALYAHAERLESRT